MLSVIIPVYNVEKYIKECLDSIVCQDGDIEVLIVDDGSKDGSAEIAKTYLNKDKRFKYLVKENGGLSDARNFGVQHCTGDYVFFVDSDDYIEKDAISLILSKIKDNPDCVVFDVNYFWEGTDQRKVVKGIVKGIDGDIKKQLLAAPPSAWNKVFKKEILLKHKEPVGRYYEDLATSPMMIYEANKISCIDKPLYYYRQRSGSIMYSFNEKCFDIYKDFEEVMEYYINNNATSEYKDILEYMMIDHILLNANRRYISRPNAKELIKEARDFVNRYFDKPLQNKYMNIFSFNDRLFIKLAYYNKLSLIKLLIKVKGIIKK